MTTNTAVLELISERVGISFKGDSMTLPSQTAATDCLAETAGVLLEEGYIMKSDLPIESGFKRYLLNTEKKHQNGEEMIRPKEVTEGVFLETNYNKEGIRRKIQTLLEIAKSE